MVQILYTPYPPAPSVQKERGKKGNVFFTRQIKKAGLGFRFLGSSLNAGDKPLCSDRHTFPKDYSA